MNRLSVRYLNKSHTVSNIKIGRISSILLLILIGFQSIYNCSSNTIYIGIGNKIFYNQDYVSYKGYYAEELFNDIKDDIGKKQKDYRIGCIGFDPAVALYNGFYTIDGYIQNYPLSYKHRFRKLIERELDKDSYNKWKFDSWGSRCYILVAELGKDYNRAYKWKDLTIEDLELNSTAYLDLEVDFIFSAVKIKNYYLNNLTLFNTYNHEDSIWKIYAYKVRIVSVDE